MGATLEYDIFERHWQTGVHLVEDYWVCEGPGNHVTWGAFGENENIYPREGWLGNYMALYYSERINRFYLCFYWKIKAWNRFSNLYAL